MKWDEILKNAFDLPSFSKLPYDTQIAEAEKQQFNPGQNVKEAVEEMEAKAVN